MNQVRGGGPGVEAWRQRMSWRVRRYGLDLVPIRFVIRFRITDWSCTFRVIIQLLQELQLLCPFVLLVPDFCAQLLAYIIQATSIRAGGPLNASLICPGCLLLLLFLREVSAAKSMR